MDDSVDDYLLHDELEDWSYLERQFSRTRSAGLGQEVIRRIICGTYVLSSDRLHSHYEAAATVRAILTQQLHQALEAYDCLLIPTTISPPVSLQRPVDPTSIMANDIMTVAVSLAGLPSIAIPSVPVPTSMMVRPSFQLIGPRRGENKILRAALALEGNYRDWLC
jgi:aspartyl-tRNA(Asn)/glutamyl-tRNA(Gln) amidotransferase subunit A